MAIVGPLIFLKWIQFARGNKVLGPFVRMIFKVSDFNPRDAFLVLGSLTKIAHLLIDTDVQGHFRISYGLLSLFVRLRLRLFHPAGIIAQAGSLISRF